MSDNQKSRAKAEQALGKLKEAAGRAVGNDRLAAEGRRDQVKGDARQAKEKMKDIFRHRKH
ncbi:CsbD family protein [Streptomyces sp. NPDC006512]|uniref:CsbD family protein n=1 Tax=Streptomyces sp. NPDC006512 TaxID=3154307 RepID=UPI0033A2191E